MSFYLFPSLIISLFLASISFLSFIFLPLHQYTKNIRFHSGINRSPYAAMFGQEPEDDATIVNDEIAPTSEDDALEQTINAAENILVKVIRLVTQI
ncbi:unnamed protein product, partial [Mesorhabditis belari]|uniref:Uncharacterized protein n=1 Tax=Mesorhabditis belari TaxID=2138241 RepID=A0AAF3FI90_9BILA